MSTHVLTGPYRTHSAGGPWGFSVATGILATVVTALGCSIVALGLGQAGVTGLVVGAGCLAMVFGLLVVRNHSLFLLLALVGGLQVVFHKSLGPQSTTVSSGPLAVYITSLNVVVLALYGLWFFEGSVGSGLRQVLQRRVFLVPFLGGLAQVPSIVVAQDLGLAIAELLQMVFGFALYVYVAQRVRTRREVGILLGGLLVVAAVQCALVVLQWRTGSALGLGFLGEQSNLTTRSLDAAEIPRPSGTAAHPDLMASLVGPIGLLGLALAVNLRRRLSLRLLCLLGALLGAAPLVLAQTRAAVIGELAGATLLVVCGVWQRRLPIRAVLLAAGAAAVGAFIFRAQIVDKIIANAGTDHFQLEVQSRLELNGVALDMIRNYPVLGVGVNNFQTVMDRFDTYGLIFAGNPVHNLFLLTFTETGFIGLLGLLATFIVLVGAAIRLARVGDRFLSTVGFGVLAVYIFFLFEEQLMFALRHDIPRALFWLLAGLVVACWRMHPQSQRARVP